MKNFRLFWLAPIATIAILFGSYGLTSATGYWVSSGKTEITAETKLTADDLKGWMTLQQAATGLGVDVQQLIALVGAPAGVTLTPETAFKDIEGLVPGFELTAFRDKVRALTGEAVVVPAPTTPAAAPSPAQPPATTPQPAAPAASTHTPTGTGTGAGSTQSITGQSTIRQIAQANGLDPALLAKEAGIPATMSLDAALKDIKSAVPGFEIQAVRDAVDRLT